MQATPNTNSNNPNRNQADFETIAHGTAEKNWASGTPTVRSQTPFKPAKTPTPPRIRAANRPNPATATFSVGPDDTLSL